MGVADHAARHGIQITQQQIGGFSAHTGNFEKLLHGAGNLSAVVTQQHLAAQNDVPCLVLIETAGVYQFLHMSDISPRHGFQCWVGGEQGRGHQVHPCVGALGGQPHGNHQLVVLIIVQGTQGVWIALLQQFNDGVNFFFHSRISFSFFLLIPRIRKKDNRFFG